jgi:hypothetical protein
VKELEPYVAFYKIASYELLWHGLLEACAATKKPVVISTGMATLPEIKSAVATLQRANCTDITVLHCVSAYPAPPEEANLSAIAAIRDAVGVPVGWSDHTRSPAVIERAVHRWGASAIEFHLDLDGRRRIKPAIAGCRTKLLPSLPASAKAKKPTVRASRSRLPPSFPIGNGAPIRSMGCVRCAMCVRIGCLHDSYPRRRAACRRDCSGANGLDAAAGKGFEADRGKAAAVARASSSQSCATLNYTVVGHVGQSARRRD